MPRSSRPRSSAPRRRRAVLTLSVLAAGVVGAAVSACSPVISVPAAANATDPACADVVLDLPDQVAGQDQRTTSSQATSAWGGAGSAITLRCGVEQPGPSDQCQSIENPDGSSVDWVATESSSGWTFVTYGRDPAIEVQVPQSLGEGQPTVALVDVAPAVLDVRATKRCTS
ncbi:DUF3515 family protein [Luteimicrobium sp. DT211]|uniref:DUF3515 family protein n=1 Tax=Luteimicrobium sp. DT211 TaxID=3393412 RepID=UPI003CE78CFD